MNKDIKDVKRKGRIYQTGIYLGKFFRMFVYQSDWKVMPMAAVIAQTTTMLKTQRPLLTLLPPSGM